MYQKFQSIKPLLRNFSFNNVKRVIVHLLKLNLYMLKTYIHTQKKMDIGFAFGFQTQIQTSNSQNPKFWVSNPKPKPTKPKILGSKPKTQTPSKPKSLGSKPKPIFLGFSKKLINFFKFF